MYKFLANIVIFSLFVVVPQESQAFNDSIAPKPYVYQPTKSSKKRRKGVGKRKYRKKGSSKRRGKRSTSKRGRVIKCGSAPICGTFNKALSKCGCQILSPRITRQRRGGRSCHNSGRAIDVMGISCDGKKYSGYAERYAKWVRCMTPSRGRRGKRKGNGLISLYRQSYKRRRVGDTQAHYDHAHFSIGCHGGRYW